MTKRVQFPTTAWFERLAERMRSDEAAYRELGPIDCTMVVKVDLAPGPSVLHAVTFEGFGVKSIRRIERAEDAGPSRFVIEGPLEAWREMIESIRRHGAADLEHTLNSLTLPDVPLRVSGPDQLETDAFYRYNETLQRFFDGAASVETSFPPTRAPRAA